MTPKADWSVDLFPFTLTRSVLDIRIGIATLREKWEQILGHRLTGPDQILLNGIAVPDNTIPGTSLFGQIQQKIFTGDDLAGSSKKLCFPWQIFQWNGEEIRNDFEWITRNRKSAPLSSTNKIIEPENIFLEEGARVEFATINASEGPVYIGRNATVMEGAMIRGPFSLGEGAMVKMGAAIYGATTIGPFCIAGGEIKNSVLFGYSNKSHEGYLGDSVIGEWCNLGAGTSNSNLKNNAGKVKIWNDPRKEFLEAGNKCGLMMGDYSRAAINTSFNTGTVVGASANVFGNGLTPNYIPSFSWGFSEPSRYHFEKAMEDIAQWKRLKNEDLNDNEIRTLKHIFENT